MTIENMKNPAVRNIKGVSSWQIFQQGKDGSADIRLSAELFLPADFANRSRYLPVLRIVQEESSRPASNSTLWQPADEFVKESLSFKHKFSSVPAGGPYRIEFGIAQERQTRTPERFLRAIHAIGVGDLWVIAGQSNAAGIGQGIAEDGPEIGVHILQNDEEWKLAMHPLNDPADSMHPNIESFPRHSPFLSFAKILRRELNHPIGLIQTSLGGSPLRLWNPDEDGSLYRNMLHCINLAGGKVKGVVWYQGCSDANAECSGTYYERFRNYVVSTRKTLKQPDLPFITTQLNCWHGSWSSNLDEDDRQWSIIRETQRRFANENPNVAVVPALGLPLSDGIHNSTAGNLELGARYAYAALGMAYGRNISWKYPDIKSIRLTEDNKLLFEFDNVSSALNSFSGKLDDWRIIDDNGMIGCGTLSYLAPNQVAVNLERNPVGKIKVSSSYGINPQVTLYDIHEHRPVLAFHDFPAN